MEGREEGITLLLASPIDDELREELVHYQRGTEVEE
jgi:hypothetical protein